MMRRVPRSAIGVQLSSWLLVIAACSSNDAAPVVRAKTTDAGPSTDAGRSSDAGPTHFRVTLRNTSDGSYRTSQGTELPVVFGPGVFAVGSGEPPLFRSGEAATPGFEQLAEDGMPKPAFKELEARRGFDGGLFGADSATTYDDSPLVAGKTADFVLDAVPGDRLEFAMMWSQSNDVFVATEPGGVPLFDGGLPLVGVVTTGISLWDAGTEVNQEPGLGDSQAPRQAAPGDGQPEGGVITELISNRDASGFSYPSLADTLEISFAAP
jgi:hypothetical protein